MAPHEKELFEDGDQFDTELLNIRLDDHQPSAREEDAPELGYRPLLIHDMVESIDKDNPVKYIREEWQSFNGGTYRLQVPGR